MERPESEFKPAAAPDDAVAAPRRWHALAPVALAALLGAATGAALRSAPADALECAPPRWDLTLETHTAAAELADAGHPWPERAGIAYYGWFRSRAAAADGEVQSVDCGNYW